MAEYEVIPYSVLSSVVNKLTSFASTDFGLINGVQKQLQDLEAAFVSIKAVLPNAELEGGPAVQQWIASLKDVVHAADDLFDDIFTENLLLLSNDSKTAKVRNFFSSSNPLVSRFQFAREINKLEKDVNAIVKSMPRLNLDMSRLNLRQRSERKTSSLVRPDIVGREDVKNDIINLLMQPDGTQKVSVVGVVGMGGIGKTTIAQMVYNDEQVVRFFEKRLWVYVSDDFDVKTILKTILQSLSTRGDGEISDQESLDDLLNKVEKNLVGERYLLVLDDVWNESPEKWTKLQTCLMHGAQGSKILVTTRNAFVAQVMGASFVFPLECLNEENSWKLLMKQVSRSDAINDAMGYVLRKIALKCKGVPLGINTMAGMLLSKHSEGEWITVLEGDFLNQGKEKYDTGILSVLELSYQHLPPQLKQCFTYFSVFPKGWEIEKNELIQLWMAQGYLECSNNVQQMEDVGNGFVNTLLQRSFLVGKEIDEYGNLVSFQMHDLIHDLALLEAGNDYYLKSKKIDRKPMHISIPLESNILSLLDSFDSNRPRTFFLQRPADMDISHMNGELSVILSFKRLRVLNLSRSSIKILPHLIGKLKNLRYLDLSWCVKLASLHKSIGDLVNLQTLKLTGCETLQFSTEVVTKLINLRHLEIHRCKAFEEMMPAGLGKLSSLQSLSSFSVVDDRQTKKAAGKLNELQYLNNLRGNLQINRLNQVREVVLESQGVNLKEKHLLESLALNWENEEKMENSLELLENLHPNQHLKGLRVRWYPGVTFSNWLSSITNLSHISLFGFNNCQCLPPLEHLPYLKSLEIGSMKAMEYIYLESEFLPTEAAPFFRSLERLKISGCEKLQGWKMMNEDDSPHDLLLPPFLRLSQLIINKCPRLTCLPTFPNVEELELCESMVKPLRETLDTPLLSSTTTTPLSMLKSLKIRGKLVDIRGFQSQWTQNLTSLEYLEFADVEELELWFVNNLPSLRKIIVYDCDIRALPDGMCNLLSLQHIKLLGCQNLALLPEGMSGLTNLVTLEIWDCPLLVERCQRETGLDWPKISHVSNILLKQNERRIKAHFSAGFS